MSGGVGSSAAVLPQAISVIGNELAAAQARLGQIVGLLQTAGEAMTTGRPTESSIRRIIQGRTRRARYFDADLFADPAWDMLLELYACELGQRRLTVSNLCLAACVPATTALRWLSILERRGLAARQNDPLDRRRIYVRLTPSGVSAMEAFFGEPIESRMAA